MSDEQADEAFVEKDDGEEYDVVESIVDHEFRRGKLTYEVKWASQAATTWEPESVFLTSHLIDNYWAGLGFANPRDSTLAAMVKATTEMRALMRGPTEHSTPHIPVCSNG